MAVTVLASEGDLSRAPLDGPLTVLALREATSVLQRAHEVLRGPIVSMGVYDTRTDPRLDETIEALEARDAEHAERLVVDHALDLRKGVEQALS